MFYETESFKYSYISGPRMSNGRAHNRLEMPSVNQKQK